MAFPPGAVTGRPWRSSRVSPAGPVHSSAASAAATSACLAAALPAAAAPGPAAGVSAASAAVNAGDARCPTENIMK